MGRIDGRPGQMSVEVGEFEKTDGTKRWYRDGRINKAGVKTEVQVDHQRDKRAEWDSMMSL